MEVKINKIISKLTNVLFQLNPNDFLNKIKESKDVNESVETSKKFCEHITNVKGQILFDIPEELSSLIQKDNLINESNNSLINNNIEKNNDIKNSSIKNILASFKLKLFNLNANISELNINLNNISSNLKKHKYSLATKRIENLIKLKDKMSTNVNFLDGIRNRLYENNDSINYKNINDSNKKKIILAKSPSPIRVRKNSQNLSTIQLNSKNLNLKKNTSSNKMLNISTKRYNTIESKRKSKSSNNLTINTTPKRNKKIQISKFNNTINNSDSRNNLTVGLFDKEKDELINKLKSEIEILNQKNKNIYSNDKNQISKLNLEKDILLFFNEKLSKISDLIFSITFLISNIQNKYSQISSEKELNEINNNLMQMTSFVSEIKTKILKMSIENKNIFTSEINNTKNTVNIEKDFDISLYQTRIKSLQSENQNLKSLIEELNIKIISLNEKISSSKSDNSEIFSLKEKLNQSEKKISEMKNIYEADLSSKTLIENLLQKNLEEQKIYYEDKISKLNKKIEEINKESKIFSSREDQLKIMKNDDIFSLKEINSSFANEINSIKNVMSNNNDISKIKNEVNELNEKIAKKDKEIICLITNTNKEKKIIIEKYEKEKDELNQEINKLKLIIGNAKDKYENGGEIQFKINNNEKEKIRFKNLLKINEISLDFKSNLIIFSDKEEKDNNFSDEEDDEDTDEEFIIKLKNINENKIDDNKEIKIYKKENRKLIHRYEDALDENHELKKKMILIEEIVINKQNELYNNLKKGFRDLLIFLNINNKSKGKIIYFLNLIQFSEQEIKLIIGKKR